MTSSLTEPRRRRTRATGSTLAAVLALGAALAITPTASAAEEPTTPTTAVEDTGPADSTDGATPGEGMPGVEEDSPAQDPNSGPQEDTGTVPAPLAPGEGPDEDEQADPVEEIRPFLVPGFPAPTVHTQEAFDPAAQFTSRWTRADARQIKAMSDPGAPGRIGDTPAANSLPEEYTMPSVPIDFPETNGDVWVWDTWTLTDGRSDQYSFKGWEIAFSLVADRLAGYGFDDRHTEARLCYF